PQEGPQAGSPERRGGGVDGVTILGWAGIGTGAIGVAVGTYLWIDAGGIYTDVRNRCAEQPPCGDPARSSAAHGQALENWARVGWIAGGAVLAGGVTVLVVHGLRARQSRVSLGPGAVHWAASF